MPYASVLAAATMWGTIGVAYRVLSEYTQADEIAVVTIRAGAATLMLGAWLLIQDRDAFRVHRADLPFLIVFGLVTVTVFYLALIFTFSRTTVAVGTLLLYLAPAIVVLGGAVFLGESLTRERLGALAVAFLGCLLVVRVYRLDLLRGSLAGIGFGLVAAASYAAYSLMGKPLLQRYRVQTVLLYHLVVGTVGLVAVKLAVSPLTWPDVKGLLLIGGYTGLVTTLLPITFYSIGLRAMPSGDASILAMLEPVVALVLATVILGERLGIWQMIGGTLVLGAVVLLARQDHRAKSSPAPVLAPRCFPMGRNSKTP
ncbi:MAG: DMT family transporter [Chloroflexota bacterium]|nr:DMT family transporter [Chloroflexota bacterium]